MATRSRDCCKAGAPPEACSMLDGDAAAPAAAPGLTGKGGYPSFGGTLLSDLHDVGFALLGAVLVAFPSQKKVVLFLFVGDKGFSLLLKYG